MSDSYNKKKLPTLLFWFLVMLQYILLFKNKLNVFDDQMQILLIV